MSMGCKAAQMIAWLMESAVEETSSNVATDQYWEINHPAIVYRYLNTNGVEKQCSFEGWPEIIVF